MRNRWIACVGISLAMAACNPPETEKTPVAEVGEDVLYLEDIAQVIPGNLAGADSSLWVDDFIQKWVQNELVILNAEQNLSAEQKNVDKELKEYRNSLLTYRYKKELMAQKMDTVILDSNIEAYYNLHLDKYQLQDNIFKLIYLKIPIEVASPEIIKSLCDSETDDNYQQISEYGIQYAKVFDRFEDKWVSWERLKQLWPEEINIDEQFLRRNKFIESSDTDYYYFICIRDFRLAGDHAPVEYVNSEIRNILLNERKIQFLKTIDDDIYKEGVASNKFKIYNIKK